MKSSLLILAAGMGSRFGGLKQMEGLGPSGETLLEFAVYDAIKVGIDRVVFIIRDSFEEDFKSLIASKFDNKIEVKYAFQDSDLSAYGIQADSNRSKPWGTGHAVLAAKRYIDGPFAVINSDDFYGRDALSKLKSYFDSVMRGDGPEGCLVGFPVGNTLSENGSVSRGFIEMNSSMYLENITEFEGIEQEDGLICAKSKQGESKILNPEDLVSVNCFGFAPQSMDAFEDSFKRFLGDLADPLTSEFYLPSAVTDYRAMGAKIEVVGADSKWLGVTYKEDKKSVQSALKSLVEKGEYPSGLWA